MRCGETKKVCSFFQLYKSEQGSNKGCKDNPEREEENCNWKKRKQEEKAGADMRCG
jgi:hypothetical protein